MFEERLRGMLLGLVLAEHGVFSSAVHASPAPSGLSAEMLESCMASLLDRHGFDGADQVRRFSVVVATDPAAATPVERLVAGMVQDGAIWDEPARVLQDVPDASSHHAVVRALAAAILAPDNHNYRPWLAERLVALTHQSIDATTAGVIAADAAAALLRGEQLPRRELAAAAHAGVTQTHAGSGGDALYGPVLVLTVAGLAAAAPNAAAAVGAVLRHPWADQRAVALAGALAGASTPTALPPPPAAVRATVDRLQVLGQHLLGRPRELARTPGA